jgi:hypothetical protein
MIFRAAAIAYAWFCPRGFTKKLRFRFLPYLLQKN